MYHQHQSVAGYSLIEVLVAISILLIAIVGPMTIASKGLQNAQFAREQTQATFLAQEGLELVLSYRDDAALSNIDDVLSGGGGGASWDWINDSDLNDCKASAGCGIYFTSATNISTVSCAVTDACVIYYDDTETGRNRYGHDLAAAPTQFQRVIEIDDSILGCGSQCAMVRSTVTWSPQNFSTARTVVVETYVYDIYDY